MVAHSRGVFRTREVLKCVYEELKQRKLEETPTAKGIFEEIEVYRRLFESSPEEEEALIEATRTVEEETSWQQTQQSELESDTASELDDDADDLVIVSDTETTTTANRPGTIQHTAVLSPAVSSNAGNAQVSVAAGLERDESHPYEEAMGETSVSSDNSTAAGPSGLKSDGSEPLVSDAETLAGGVEENQLAVFDIGMDGIWREEEPERDNDAWFKELICMRNTGVQQGRGKRRNQPAYSELQPPGNRIEIIQESARYFKRFKLRGREIVLRVREPPQETSVMGWLEGAFNDLLTYITNCCEGGDYVGISFTASNLAHGPVWLSFRPARDYVFEDIWQLISSVAQSSESFDLNDECIIKTCIVKGVEGSGRRKGLTHESVAKRSILTISNNDNLCLPRSLAAALAYAERGEIRTGDLHTKWQRVRQINRSPQKDAAIELTRRARVQVPKNGCRVNEIAQYQDCLAQDGVAIVVFEFLALGRRNKKAIFNGTKTVMNAVGRVRHTLYILYYERSHHFQPILNLRGAVGSTGFCTDCDTLYLRLDHRCAGKKICSRCLRTPPCDPHTHDTIRCVACNRVFFGETCLKNHETAEHKNKPTVCASIKRCPSCFGSIRPLVRKNKHVCAAGYCPTCKSDQPYNHLCFMRPLPIDKETKNKIFIFYDFETQQCTPLKGTADTFVHEPNLCVAQRVCTFCCENDSIVELCRFCGVHEFVYKHNPVAQLVELAMQEIKGFSGAILIAHNAGGFDAQFILRYFINEKKTQLPSLIMNGTKIITMRIGKLVFLDSLHYFHMPLSKLPKSFGLTEALAKGTFPHLFNTPDNQHYIGELPSMEYYSPNNMPTSIRNDIFEPWYRGLKNEGYVFDFQKEIVAYCRNDVTILRQACVVFRKMFIDVGSVCPFDEGTTIASACFRIFRKNFLKADAIGIIPRDGYRWANNQSKKAVGWLVWMEHSLGQRITHAGRSREFKIPQGLMVDGYYKTPDTAHVLQFHGCYWHGCPRCFLVNRDQVQGDGVSMNERHERTIAVGYKIRSSGYRLTEIWECEYDRMLDTNEQMRSFVRGHALVTAEPLNPRDAFFGGRTENMVTLYDVEDSEQIRYVDVCSLYPYICKYGKFPVGHPKVYVGDECMALTGPDNNDLTKVEGLVKCTVLPPRNLYHPVLPVRMHQRLLFALCRSCCESMNQGECTHERTAERVFNGTWVVDELRKAVSCGYRVIRVEEIWQYEITQYNRDTRSGGHFSEYINTFLKIKQESSGWPTECVGNGEAQAQYIADFERSEGVKLDHEAITKNPGLRQVAKLCLNSFWGKFGQRENLPQTVIVSTRSKLMDLLTSPEYEITGILPVNHYILYVSCIKNDDAVIPSGIANSVIAAYTTAQARLKLYSYLEHLDRRALYCDTDSVIYVTKNNPGEYEPPTGQLLGDLTDELEPGCYIKSFVSGGPKFYSFITVAPDGTESEVCKVKGISLNFANSQLINYKTIRSYLVGNDVEPTRLKFDAIRRTPFHQVVTRTEKKTCKPSSVKRRHYGEYGSLPYGYKA